MADGIASADATAILNWFARATTAAAATAFYVKLHIGDPGAAGTSNPATETTRKALTFGAPSSGATDNTGAVSWTNYPAAETISWVSVWDHVTGGSFKAKKALTANKTPAIGDTVTLAVGDFDITMVLAS